MSRSAQMIRALLAVALCGFALPACGKGTPASAAIPAEVRLYAVVPSLGELMRRLDRLETRLPATGNPARAALRWAGVEARSPDALDQLGLRADSDVVVALQGHVLVVALGRVRPSRLLPLLGRRIEAAGWSARAGPSGSDREVHDAEGRLRGRIRERDGGLLLLAFDLSPAREGKATAGFLDRALSLWTAPVKSASAAPGGPSAGPPPPEGTVLRIRRRAGSIPEDLPSWIGAAAAKVADLDLALVVGDAHVELRLDADVPLLVPVLALLRPVRDRQAAKAGRGSSLADRLPLDTTGIVRWRLDPRLLGLLPSALRERLLAPLRSMWTPWLPFPIDPMATLLPFLDGPITHVGFGLDPGFRIGQIRGGRNPLDLASAALRTGLELEVSDPAALARAWQPTRERLEKMGYRVTVGRLHGLSSVQLRNDKRTLATVLVEGRRIRVFGHPRDVEVQGRLRKGKRSPLARRLTDDLARRTVAGEGCLLCVYAQLVRLTRDLERRGLPTFHLQMLGSIYQILVRVERREQGLRFLLRVDL